MHYQADNPRNEATAFPGFDRPALDLVGEEMLLLMERLFPLCRSITGQGVRDTLGILREIIPLEVHEVASGTQVFDWKVPQEWNVTDAFVRNLKGEKVIDFRQSNLHLLYYSRPVRGRFSLAELKKHLYSDPDHPDWIPYRTSYYHETWGFCLAHNQLLALEEDEYEVVVDTSLKDGSLTYGESLVAGESPQEVLISAHICHPSLANDNLSGVVVAVLLARTLATVKLRYSYRFLFIPGTIGSITWLSIHESQVCRIKHGLVAVCLGDSGGFTYKKSRRGDAEIDRIAANVLQQAGVSARIIDFFPYGYDERQYCSPGFNLPVGCLMRTPHGEYPEYHTSADNLSLVSAKNLAQSFEIFYEILCSLEANRTYLNTNAKCEPQLGKRGLYAQIGGQVEAESLRLDMLWVLNLADGQHSLLDISERSGISLRRLIDAVERLKQGGLLELLAEQ